MTSDGLVVQLLTAQATRLDEIQRATALSAAASTSTREKCEDLCDRVERVEKAVGRLTTADRVRGAREKLVLGALGVGGGVGGYGLVQWLAALFGGGPHK